MDRKWKSEDAKRKEKLAMPPTRKSPRLASLLPFAPPASPKSVLRSNKLLVLAIAAARGEPNPKAQASAQAIVEKPPADVKGKKAARISVKPLRKRFPQRIIAYGGPSRPKPKKAVVIDLVGDEEEEARDKETAAEEPPLVAAQAEEEEEKNILKSTLLPTLHFRHSLLLLSQDQESMTTHTTGTTMEILISGALMWSKASQLQLITGILQRRRRRTALPHPTPQTRDRTLFPQHEGRAIF
ncbi:hypothetical protein PIB30_044260 [Stylosanthes scabra]|uniref:Uncharacterized protein n=1 Tax=Stylosanthes scabra TaxID=79078 RepID=A0ABU6ZEJ2_9FABA|nr:hypothetical protein [Stylosanthes scabra]